MGGTLGPEPERVRGICIICSAVPASPVAFFGFEGGGLASPLAFLARTGDD